MRKILSALLLVLLVASPVMATERVISAQSTGSPDSDTDFFTASSSTDWAVNAWVNAAGDTAYATIVYYGNGYPQTIASTSHTTGYKSGTEGSGDYYMSCSADGSTGNMAYSTAGVMW